MSKELVLDYIRQLKANNYLVRFRSLHSRFEGSIKQMVMESLNIRSLNEKSVTFSKKYDLKHKDPLDYIPSVDFEDRSFPLDLLFKEQFERAFDTDLSMVKIHTGEYSHEMASNYGAKAVTVGNNIYFARGMYSPYTEEGQSLLAHEIQHVVQYNDKDQFFLYDEDIALAEYMAESVESQVKNMKLHSVNSGVFNQDTSVDRGNPEDFTNDTAPEISSDKSLDDFSSENSELRYEITFENGKVYNLSKEDRAELIDMTTIKVTDYIESELTLLPDDEKDKFLLKVLKYVN